MVMSASVCATPILPAVRGTVAALLLAAGTAASANGGVWINPAGGAWNVAGNWDPAIVPNSSAAFAEIGVGGAYLVTLPSGTTSVGTLLISNPDAVVRVPFGGTLNLHAPGGDVSGVLQLNQFSGSTSQTTLNAPESTTLAGGGVTRLSGLTVTRAQITTAVGAVLTIADEHTVAGAGRILGILDNHGRIVADDEDGLTLQIVAPSIMNHGSLEAAGGGNLVLAGISVDQSAGGQILADGFGSLVEFSGNGSVVGGTLSSSPDAEPLTRQSGATTLEDVALTAGELFVAPGGTISIAGSGLTNDGLLSLNNFSGSVSQSSLNASGPVALLGSGTVRLSGTTNTRAQITASGGGSLAIGAEHTVAGAGRIIAPFSNEGLIDADAPGLQLLINTANASSSGTMRASGGGLLSISNTTIDQSAGGQILADGAGSLVEFSGSGSVAGGTLSSSPDAEPLTRQSGTTTLEDVALTAGELFVAPGGTINIAGSGLTNDGLLSLNNFSGSVSSSTLNALAPVSLLGSGAVRLVGLTITRAQITASGGGSLTIGGDHMVAGAGRITAPFTNEGLIDADVPDFQLQINTANATNSGTMRASGGGWLVISNTTIDQSAGGQILAEGIGSLVDFNNTCLVIGGTLATSPDAPAIRRQSGVTTLQGVLNTARITIAAGGTITVADPEFTNHGRIAIGDFSGSVSSVAMNFSSPDPVVSGVGEFAFSKPTGGAPRILGTGVLTNGVDHMISGRGQILLGLHNEGTIKPGDPTGTISIQGSYSAGASSEHHITLAGASDFSRITATGPITADGSIVLSVAPGFLPPVGSSYSIITGSTATGTMNLVEAPVIAGLVFNTVTLSDRVNITVTVCADLNGDGVVNADDLGILLSGFGGLGAGDINGDGVVNADDLGLLLAGFGTNCP